MTQDYISSALKQFQYYKILGEKTFAQLTDEQLFWQYNDESNSIATIVKHLSGNMKSRWTDFLTSDGEKKWRNREEEFENDIRNRDKLMQIWEEGWAILFLAIDPLTTDDLEKIIYIRNIGHTVTEAINRQLAHYPYHIGQIVFIGKMLADNEWLSLSIPRGSSSAYNAEKFSKAKHKGHFTDEVIGFNKNKVLAKENQVTPFQKYNLIKTEEGIGLQDAKISLKFDETLLLSFEAASLNKAMEIRNHFLDFDPYIPFSENIVATRTLTLYDIKQKPITDVNAFIYQPIKVNDGEWHCEYHINIEYKNSAGEPLKSRALGGYKIIGYDMIQAIKNALIIMDSIIKAYNENNDEKIFWLEYGKDCGFMDK